MNILHLIETTDKNGHVETAYVIAQNLEDVLKHVDFSDDAGVSRVEFLADTKGIINNNRLIIDSKL